MKRTGQRRATSLIGASRRKHLRLPRWGAAHPRAGRSRPALHYGMQTSTGAAAGSNGWPHDADDRDA